MSKLALLFLLLPALAFGTPEITAVSGEVSHGEEVIVTGTGFGSKDQPYVIDSDGNVSQDHYVEIGAGELINPTICQPTSLQEQP